MCLVGSVRVDLILLDGIVTDVLLDTLDSPTVRVSDNIKPIF